MMNGLLIGCQNAIQRRIGAYNRFRDAQIIGVWDPDASAARTAAEALRSNPRPFDQAADMIDSLSADFIDLALPVNEFNGIIDAAASKRLNVIFDSSTITDEIGRASCRERV